MAVADPTRPPSSTNPIIGAPIGGGVSVLPTPINITPNPTHTGGGGGGGSNPISNILQPNNQIQSVVGVPYNPTVQQILNQQASGSNGANTYSSLNPNPTIENAMNPTYNIETNAGGGVTVYGGDLAGASKYVGDAFIPQVGMTANEYVKSLKQEAINAGNLDIKDYGKVSFSSKISNDNRTPEEKVISNLRSQGYTTDQIARTLDTLTKQANGNTVEVAPDIKNAVKSVSQVIGDVAKTLVQHPIKSFEAGYAKVTNTPEPLKQGRTEQQERILNTLYIAGSTLVPIATEFEYARAANTRIVKPIVKSSEIELSDAVKIATNPDGSSVWAVETKVNTIRVTPEGKVIDKVVTNGKSIITTSEDEVGAIKAAGETVAASIRRSGVRNYENPLKITQKFDLATSKGSVTLTPEREVTSGVGQSTIKDIGTIHLKKTSDAIIGRIRKFINPAEYRSLSNIISKQVYEKEAIREIGKDIKVSVSGTETGSVSKSVSDIVPTKLRVKGYDKPAPKSVLEMSKARIEANKNPSSKVKVQPYTRKPAVEPKGEVVKTLSFSKSFTPNIESVNKEIDIIGVKPVKQISNQISKQKNAASTFGAIQTKEIVKATVEKKLIKPYKVTTPKSTKLITTEELPIIKVGLKSPSLINTQNIESTKVKVESKNVSSFGGASKIDTSTRTITMTKSISSLSTNNKQEFNPKTDNALKLNQSQNNNQQNRQEQRMKLKQNEQSRLNQSQFQKVSNTNKTFNRARIEPRIKQKPIPELTKKNQPIIKKKEFKKVSKSGFVPLVKEKGKFVKIGNEVYKTKEEALGAGFKVAKSDLSRSVTAVKGFGNVKDSTLAKAQYNRFAKEFRSSKQFGKEVRVQTNALSSKRETQLIQEAKRNSFKKVEVKPFKRKEGAPSIRSIP